MFGEAGPDTTTSLTLLRPADGEVHQFLALRRDREIGGGDVALAGDKRPAAVGRAGPE